MRVYIVSVLGASRSIVEQQARSSIEGVRDAIFGIEMRLGLSVTMLRADFEHTLEHSDSRLVLRAVNRKECVTVVGLEVMS